MDKNTRIDNQKNFMNKIRIAGEEFMGSRNDSSENFPNEVLEQAKHLDLFFSTKNISLAEVLHNLKKAEEKQDKIGFDKNDVDQILLSFHHAKIQDIKSVYSGMMITDFENELKHTNSDIRVSNLINKIALKYGFKLDEANKALSLKESKKKFIQESFEDFKKEYERMCLINESKEFTEIRLRMNFQSTIEEQMG